MDVCERFEWTRKRCPLTCKHCECRDLSDCQGVTAELCRSIPEYANNFCSMTCGVCGRSDGRYIQIYAYIYVIHQSKDQIGINLMQDLCFSIKSKLHWQAMSYTNLKQMRKGEM